MIINEKSKNYGLKPVPAGHGSSRTMSRHVSREDPDWVGKRTCDMAWPHGYSCTRSTADSINAWVLEYSCKRGNPLPPVITSTILDCTQLY